MPITWIIRHWIGVVHGALRTVAVVAAWSLFPEHRMLAISLVIVVLYVFAIVVLELRWRAVQKGAG